MIHSKTVVKKALCDVCGANLNSGRVFDIDDVPRSVDHGKIVNNFGYGSNLDNIDARHISLDLCEACYRKVFKALNIALSVDDLWYLRLDNTTVMCEDNKDFYYVPYWTCIYCSWSDTGHGVATPQHLCQNVKDIIAAEQHCSLCRGENKAYFLTPRYSEFDRWEHLYNPDYERPENEKYNTPTCEINNIRLAQMRNEARTSREYLKQLMERGIHDEASG